LKPGWIKSGCIEKPVTWWQDNIIKCAKEHGYTPQQIKEYAMYINFIITWMKWLGLEKEN